MIIFIKKIKWFLQKIFRGYSDCDLWDLDYHLSEIIRLRLKAYKKLNRHGVPNILCGNNDADEKQQKKWEDILDSMIEAFDLIIKYDYQNYEAYNKKIEKGLLNFTMYFRSLWD